MVFVLRALERVSSPSEGKRRVRVGGGGRWRGERLEENKEKVSDS